MVHITVGSSYVLDTTQAEYITVIKPNHISAWPCPKQMHKWLTNALTQIIDLATTS